MTDETKELFDRMQFNVEHFNLFLKMLVSFATEGNLQQCDSELKDVVGKNSYLAEEEVILSLYALCFDKYVQVMCKRAASNIFPIICSNGTLFLKFFYALYSSGKKKSVSRLRRTTFNKWFNGTNALKLAKEVTRTKSCSHWTFESIIKLVHIKPADAEHSLVFCYLLHSWKMFDKLRPSTMLNGSCREIYDYLEAVRTFKACKNETEAALMIQKHNFTIEQTPTWFIKQSRHVWKALLPGMNLKTILINLKKLALLKMLDDVNYNGTENEVQRVIVGKINDKAIVDKKQLRPLEVWRHLRDYSHGTTDLDSFWKINQIIVDELKKLYYRLYSTWKKTSKRFCIWTSAKDVEYNRKIKCSQSLHFAELMATYAVCIATNERKCRFHNPVCMEELQAKTENKVEELVIIWNLACTHGTSDLEKMFAHAEVIDVLLVMSFDAKNVEIHRIEQLFCQYKIHRKLPDSKMIVLYVESSNVLPASQDPSILYLNALESKSLDIINEFAMGNL